MIYFIYSCYLQKKTTWSVVTTRTGPDDASSVVWAIGKFFYKFLHVFYILINYLLYLHAAIYEMRDMEYGDDRNGPKRC